MQSKFSRPWWLSQPAFASGLNIVLLAALVGCNVRNLTPSIPECLLAVAVVGIPMCLMLAPRVQRYVRRLTIAKVTQESLYEDAADLFDAFVEKDFAEIMETDLDRWRNEGGA